MEELIVRINALLDRNKLKSNNSTIKIGNYNFNYTKQLLEINGVEQIENYVFEYRYETEEILDLFFEKVTININQKGASMKLVPEQIKGEIFDFDIKV